MTDGGHEQVVQILRMLYNDKSGERQHERKRKKKMAATQRKTAREKEESSSQIKIEKVRGRASEPVCRRKRVTIRRASKGDMIVEAIEGTIVSSTKRKGTESDNGYEKRKKETSCVKADRAHSDRRTRVKLMHSLVVSLKEGRGRGKPGA